MNFTEEHAKLLTELLQKTGFTVSRIELEDVNEASRCATVFYECGSTKVICIGGDSAIAATKDIINTFF
ncbi:MAG: hypothetical protein ACTTHG_02940 [Treponemataceae bacterium]